MNMNESIKSVTLTKVCNIKPFKGAEDSKQVTLAVKYDGLTLGDVFAKALRSDVISWQNGPGRKGYDGLIDKSTVNISAKAPGAVTVDPETAMVAKLISMSPEEQTNYLQKLMSKASLDSNVEALEESGLMTNMTVKKINPPIPEAFIKVDH